jgi:hypothetical protein
MKHLCIVTIFIACLGNSALAQNIGTKISEDSMIRKWRRAIINLECKSFNSGLEDSLIELRLKKIIDRSTFDRKSDSVYLRPTRAWGTAIFLKYKGNRYLVTARHVLHDTFKKDSNAICDRITVVPEGTSLDVDSVFLPPLFIYNLYLSSVYDDIAIIGLDELHMNSSFADILETKGYEPISIQDISSSWNYKKGNRIMIVGFPDFSKVRDRHSNRGTNLWEATIISLPVMTYGVISDTSVEKNMFSGEIFSYHGNSGGAVIKDNKLIGIVSGFIMHPIRDHIGSKALSEYYLQKMRFIKSPLIYQYLPK